MNTTHQTPSPAGPWGSPCDLDSRTVSRAGGRDESVAMSNKICTPWPDDPKEPERDWAGPYEFYQQAGPRELKLKRRHWLLGQAGGSRRGVAIVFGDDDGPVKLLAASYDLAAALEAWMRPIPQDREPGEYLQWLHDVSREALAKAGRS